MSHCPVCDAPVADDFGLIECASCGAQLLVHMDGTVEHQGKEPIGDFAPAPPLLEPEVEFDFGDGDDDAIDPDINHAAANEATQMRTMERPPGAANPGAQDLVPPAEGDDEFGMPEDDVFGSGRDYTPDVNEEDAPVLPDEEAEPAKEFLGDDAGDAEAGESDAAEPEAGSEDLFPEFDGSEDQGPAPLAYNQAPASASSDLGDVASFGNSEASGGREGPLRYNLFIEGIDTVDVRESFREALTDRKLMWDTDQILRSIRNGNVNIPNVAPTKAYILITRLRGMPVQVRWEQYAISQS